MQLGFTCVAGMPVARALGGSRRPCFQSQAGPADVKLRGLAVRRPAGGRPEVVNDYIFKQIHVLTHPCIQIPGGQIGCACLELFELSVLTVAVARLKAPVT